MQMGESADLAVTLKMTLFFIIKKIMLRDMENGKQQRQHQQQL